MVIKKLNNGHVVVHWGRLNCIKYFYSEYAFKVWAYDLLRANGVE